MHDDMNKWCISWLAVRIGRHYAAGVAGGGLSNHNQTSRTMLCYYA